MIRAKQIVSLMVLLMMLAGCTAAPMEEAADTEEEAVLSPVPERLSFVAPTFDRDVDNGATHDLRNSFDGPVLMLWVAAGCAGCHDWTAMLNEELQAGNVSNTTNIVSVHRYPSFESMDDVRERYTDNNSSTYTPWPLLLPSQSTTVIDAESGEMTDVGLYRAFEMPVTPTLQVLDSEGRLVWTSKTYWANATVLEEALNIMETGGLDMVAFIDVLFWFSSIYIFPFWLMMWFAPTHERTAALMRNEWVYLAPLAAAYSLAVLPNLVTSSCCWEATCRAPTSWWRCSPSERSSSSAGFTTWRSISSWAAGPGSAWWRRGSRFTSPFPSC